MFHSYRIGRKASYLVALQAEKGVLKEAKEIPDEALQEAKKRGFCQHWMAIAN